MHLYSYWAFFLVVGVCVLLISYPGLSRPLDRQVLRRTTSRSEILDGLRGYLALGVFVHHAVITYGYMKTGAWEVPSSAFYALLGSIGVSLFFMVTGYLFWEKLLTTPKIIDWLGLYIGRIFRIGPLYLAALAGMFGLVFYRTGGTLHQPAGEVLLQVLQWLGLGLFGQPPVNGYPAHSVLGMTWTLHYEWIFYFSLPALAVVAASRSHLALLVTALFILVMLPNDLLALNGIYLQLFLCGMCAASIHHKLSSLKPRSQAVGNALSGIGSAICFSLLFYIFTNYKTAYR